MKIKLENIEVNVIIGTKEDERLTPQKIFINVEYNYVAKSATKSDDLSLALDYQKLTDHIIEIAKESKCFLIETLADRILELLKSYSVIISGKVKVSKPNAIDRVDIVSAETSF